MNHWQMIAAAYALTFGAVALETVLLFRRRRAALRQAQAWDDADQADSATASGPGVAS